MGSAVGRYPRSHREGDDLVRIGPYRFGAFCDEVARFHGAAAPGVVLGGFMVDLARGRLPEGVLFEAVCETRVCLADAIQLLTPCTVGNGRVRIVHVGRFALSLYDKYTGEGARAFLDARRMDPWPELRAWFLKEKPKREQDSERLMAEIRDGGPAVIGVEAVRVALEEVRRQKIGPVRLCPGCGEAFPVAAGDRCGGCRGELPYQPPSSAQKGP